MLQTVTVPAFAAENTTENVEVATNDASTEEESTYYTLSGSTFDYLEWSPTETGNYTIVVCVIDKTGFKATYSKQFSII